MTTYRFIDTNRKAEQEAERKDTFHAARLWYKERNAKTHLIYDTHEPEHIDKIPDLY